MSLSRKATGIVILAWLGTAAGAWALPVTFKVEMGYQISQGRFHPGVDAVQARGSFQSPTNWTGGFTLTNTPATPTIYQGTYEVTNALPGALLEYKFIVNGSAWESRPNRSFVLAGTAQTLPTVYFNDAWAGGTPVPVTFQVDMSAQSALGNFHPDQGDTVEARGAFQSPDTWSAGFTLTNSPEQPNVFQGVYPDSANPPGAWVEYKFVIIAGAVTNWESGGNRSFTMSDSPQTLPLVFFNDLSLTAPVPVTFQVNMNYQADQAFFNPATDTVEVRGDFNNWSGGMTLSESPSTPGLYTGTYDVNLSPAGGQIAFKYVFVDGSLVAHFESRANRVFTQANVGQTLPAVYFNDLASASSITFQIDLAPQIAVGNFNPLSDSVEVRGTFEYPAQWEGGLFLANSLANPTIYTGAFSDPVDPPGSWPQFKFVLNGSQWETIADRAFNLSGGSQTLPVLYFNDLSALPIRAAILFQVDMTVQAATGSFNPVGDDDEVWVRGDVMGWDAPPSGMQLFEDSGRPGIYTNVFTIETWFPGTQLPYKFTIWRPGSGTTTWEDGDNRTLAFTGNEPINADGYHLLSLPTDYFNGLSFADVLAADTTVTFQVNMNGAIGIDGTVFSPAHYVFINGAFLNWWPWGTFPGSYLMYDDGVNGGDAVAGDGIYSWQQTFPRGARTRLEYAYGIDSQANETGFDLNHVRYIRSTGNYVLPVDTFGNLVQEPLANATVRPGELLRLVIHPPYLNGDRLAFSLDPGAPAGASINPTNGTFRWKPAREQSSTTNLITIRITDLDVPLLSTLETLVVTVQDYLELTVGVGAVRAGQSGSVPVSLASSDGVTNLTFTVGWQADRLGSPTLSGLPAGFAGSLVNQTTSLLITLNSSAGAVLLGTNQVLQLNFVAAPDAPSSFIPLPVTALAATKPGSVAYSNYLPHDGLVGLINLQPLLQASLSQDQSLILTVFGIVGTTYQIQYATDLAAPIWLPLSSYVQASPIQTINVGPMTHPAAFYRLLNQPPP